MQPLPPAQGPLLFVTLPFLCSLHTQALERQKEFFDSVRSERDDLREEIAKLREECKVGSRSSARDTPDLCGCMGASASPSRRWCRFHIRLTGAEWHARATSGCCPGPEPGAGAAHLRAAQIPALSFSGSTWVPSCPWQEAAQGRLGVGALTSKDFSSTSASGVQQGRGHMLRPPPDSRGTVLHPVRHGPEPALLAAHNKSPAAGWCGEVHGPGRVLSPAGDTSSLTQSPGQSRAAMWQGAAWS